MSKIAILVALFSVSLCASIPKDTQRVTFKVHHLRDGLVLEPMLAPAFGAIYDSGPELKDKDVVRCIVSETEKFRTESLGVSILAAQCGKTRLAIQSVMFDKE